MVDENKMNKVCIDKKEFAESAVAAVGVISGVVMKNTYEQMGQSGHIVSSIVGPALFLGGWVQAARVLSEKDNDGNIMMSQRTYLAFASCAAIAFAVILIKKSMADGVPVPKIAPMMFVGGWAVVGYLSGYEFNDNMCLLLRALIPVLVVLSMKILMPFQRANGIVDGPGLPLFVAAWGIFVYLNSKYKEKIKPQAIE